MHAFLFCFVTHLSLTSALPCDYDLEISSGACLAHLWVPAEDTAPLLPESVSRQQYISQGQGPASSSNISGRLLTGPASVTAAAGTSFRYNGRAVPRGQHFTALPPVFQPLHSFCLLSHSDPWASEGIAWMPYLGMSPQCCHLMLSIPGSDESLLLPTWGQGHVEQRMGSWTVFLYISNSGWKRKIF